MVGQNIGKYRVLDRVGRGGMGTVYRAIDETLHREVAVKVLNAELNDPEVARRFRAEAITVARLSHPGIATIYELLQHDGQWLMVMEFVRGETLEHLIERSGPQTAPRAAELCMASLAALAHAHAMGVVHRDLKPANIMLTESGAIKIMDFGIARVAGTEHLTNVGFMMGTPAYMAPEQVLGHEIDARADIYAMGVVFYRLLTAQLPFKGETPFAMAQAQVNNTPTPVRTLRAELPPWVDDVLGRSLAKRPEDRFQSAGEFHEAFSRAVAGQPPAEAYASSAPTSLLMTPPKMATGTIAQTMLSTPMSGTATVPSTLSSAGTTPAGGSGRVTVPVSSGAVPVSDPSPVAPTMASATPSTLPRPATGSVPVEVRPAPEPAAAPPVGAPSADARQPVAKTSSRIGMVAAAVVILALGVGAFMMLRSPAPEPPPVPAVGDAGLSAPAGPASSVEAPAAPVEPAPAAAEPAAAAPARGTAAPADVGAGSTSAAAPGLGGARGATPSGTGPAGSGSSAATAPAATGPAAPARGASEAAGRRGAAPAPPLDDSLLAVTDVRVMVVNGKKADDQEILLNFGGGQIVLLNRRAGTPIASIPYKAVLGATYIRARDPRWNTSLTAPPGDLDVGGLLRTSKHWLTLQGKDFYQILRLEDANVLRVLQTVEARTGLTIDRPKSNDRN